MELATPPPARKRYHATAVEPLPRTLRRSDLAAADVLAGRRGQQRGVDSALVGTVLYLALGVNRVAHLSGGDEITFRTSMSAGNLHPIEAYVLSPELGALCHYDPDAHALEIVRTLAPSWSVRAGTTLVLSGIPLRSCWKYGARGWRYVWWDAGTALANLLAALDAHGIAAVVRTVFADNEIADLLDCRPPDEVPLLLVHLEPRLAQLPLPCELGPPAAAVVHSGRRVSLPAAEALHLSGDLTAEDAPAWERTARSLAGASRTTAPPLGGHIRPTFEDVVVARGAARSFRSDPAPRELLTWSYRAATRAVPIDALAGGTGLAHTINVHAVDGFAPGTYRFDTEDGFTLLRRDLASRSLSRNLCLGQSRAGESAWTTFISARLHDAPPTIVGRYRRVLLLEAGVVAGRVALASALFGGAATGLAFYDRDVAASFHLDGPPLLAVAAGLRRGLPPPSGTPGDPAHVHLEPAAD